jgi:hypothetical protein
MNSMSTKRTAHLFALMKKGDDAFNSRDVAGMNATLRSSGAADRACLVPRDVSAQQH